VLALAAGGIEPGRENGWESSGHGWNGSGELGDGTTLESSSPEQILSGGVQTASAGSSHTLVVKTDGSLWAMGNNGNGQLGDWEIKWGRPISRRCPTCKISRIIHSLAVAAAISRYMRSDEHGGSWRRTAMASSETERRNNRTRRERIIASGVRISRPQHQFSLFVKTDGSLWAMGNQRNGQLGDERRPSANAPVPVLSGGVQAVAAGGKSQA